ncbi:MAG: succinate-semialdehyde dehydrogenase, partial [Flavobacterium johnsoniae]
MAIKTINPYNNKEIKSFEEFSEEAVEKKIAQADKTYQKWKTIAIKQRAELLMNVASLFRKRKEELAKLITLEMGKLIAQSEAEVEMCASVYEYYAKNAADFLEDKPIEIKDGKAFVRYTPIGIILAVEPWNYPYNQVARVAAPNIMAGNVIMVKHASNVPQCAAAIEEIFREAGAEDGIYTNLFLSSSRIAKLAEDPRIVGLSLTGSEKAGASLAEAAGKNLKKSVLELGGSDPFIILEDADLEKAVKNAVKGRFGNMGQA